MQTLWGCIGCAVAVQYFGGMTKILLVDDDPLNAAVRKAILERRHTDVLRVSNAAEALCLVEQPQFASDLKLIVSGVKYSGVALDEFISELHLRLPDLPILVIGDKSTDEPDLFSYPVEFIKRPVTADDLLSAVGQLLRGWTPHQFKTA